MSDAPLVAAVILNWNNYEDTFECLKSLSNIKYPNFQIIVVDNGSTDGSGQALADSFESADFIFNEDNMGFSGGMNTGIQRGLEEGADYIWLLNNDIVVTDKSVLQVLVEAMEENPEIGICSPVIESRADDSVWFENGHISWRSGATKHLEVAKNSGEMIESDYIPFCAALLSRELIESVGLIDDDYFLYYEDIDYCTRSSKKGYKNKVLQTTKIDHKSSSTSGDTFEKIRSYYEARNQLLFNRKHKREISLPWLYYIYMMRKVLIRALKLKLPGMKASIEGVIDGVRGVTGRGRYP